MIMLPSAQKRQTSTIQFDQTSLSDLNDGTKSPDVDSRNGIP